MGVQTQRRTDEEILSSGAVILWGQREGPTARALIPIRYPCCGQVYPRNRSSIMRLRDVAVARCRPCRDRALHEQSPRSYLPDGAAQCRRCHEQPARRVRHSSGTRYGRLCQGCYEAEQQQRADAAGRRRLREQARVCTHCGFIPLVLRQLEVHHIDGNRSNNDPTNLVVLCRNCHAYETAMQLGEPLLRS